MTHAPHGPVTSASPEYLAGCGCARCLAHDKATGIPEFVAWLNATRDDDKPQPTAGDSSMSPTTVVKALPAPPDRVHEHRVEDKGTWWEQHVFTTVARVGGEVRRVTGRAADQSTAYANCKTAAALHEGTC